jgi:hypothetical protein
LWRETEARCCGPYGGQSDLASTIWSSPRYSPSGQHALCPRAVTLSPMQPTIVLLVFALAVARVTRLITSDKITERPRDAVVSWAWSRFKPAVPPSDWDRADPPLPAYLITCPWCVSIYVAAPAAVMAWAWGDSPVLFIPALALAFSQVTGLMSTIGE